MKALCENCRAIAYCVVKLLAIKVEELDVCGSLVLSNPVTFYVQNFVFRVNYFSEEMLTIFEERKMDYSTSRIGRPASSGTVCTEC